MILAIDIGNTNIVLGCMVGGTATAVMRVETRLKRTEYEYAAALERIFSMSNISHEDFEGAVISSVVPIVTETIRRAVKMLTGCEALIVGAGVKTGLNIGIDDPTQLGADLVSAAVGALCAHAPPLIVIDMGTATTVTVVDKNRRFLGGAILPGPNIAMEALTGGASLLPHIPIEAPKRVISSNTIDCMKSGAVFGTAAALDGMVMRMEQELGESVTVIATGGLASKIVPYCTRAMEVDELLLLRGLYAIWQRNENKI